MPGKRLTERIKEREKERERGMEGGSRRYRDNRAETKGR